jgi:oligoendopeptidase F
LTVAAAGFSPMLDEAVQYMLRYGLYDFSVSQNKMDTSFTTYISDYEAPFIFSEWNGYSDNILTTLHELGHFTNYYHNAETGYSANDNLDLAEIDSQALVLLMIDYYDSFFGKLSDEAEADVLIDAMYSLISGCMEDEFQQTIYKNPEMTLDQINTLYKNLAVEYGLDEVYGYTGTEWVLISHTFQTPMYYISYAVSMVPALELFEKSQNDPEGARAAYFAILNRDQYAQLQTVLSENGLSPVFSEATIKRITALLERLV